MAQKTLKVLFKAIVLVAIFAVAFYLARIARDSSVVREMVFDYGYFGIVAVSVVSGFNLAVPIPAVAFLPLFLESGLNFWLTITLITLGVTLADSLTYVVGRLGREVIDDKRRIIIALERASERHWWAPMIFLFLFASFVPLPNEILVVPLGFLNYKFSRILPPVLAGNFMFNLIYSAGIINLFEFL